MTVIPFRPRKPDPRKPDPRNGEVSVTETPHGFAVDHMSRSGDSACHFGNYASLADAQAAARRIASELNAELEIEEPDEHWPDIHDHASQLADAGVLPDLEDYDA